MILQRGQCNRDLSTINHISTVEMQDKYEKKLFFYYCDEKYVRSHKFKIRYIFLLEGEEPEVIDEDEGKNNVEVDEKPIIALRHLTKL